MPLLVAVRCHLLVHEVRGAALLQRLLHPSREWQRGGMSPRSLSPEPGAGPPSRPASNGTKSRTDHTQPASGPLHTLFPLPYAPPRGLLAQLKVTHWTSVHTFLWGTLLNPQLP